MLNKKSDFFNTVRSTTIQLFRTVLLSWGVALQARMLMASCDARWPALYVSSLAGDRTLTYLNGSLPRIGCSSQCNQNTNSMKN
jgi:hypothetical protein